MILPPWNVYVGKQINEPTIKFKNYKLQSAELILYCNKIYEKIS